MFLALPGAFAAGCAITPPGLSSSNATQLTFRFSLAGPVNPSYIYMVAIRVLNPPFGTDTTLSDPTQVPVPVISTGSKNGIVEGLPTHYVIYTEQTPNLYQVYQFPTQVQAPDPSETTAMNLTWPGIYLRDVMVGSGVDPRPTTGGSYGNQLGFTIDTSYLDQAVSTATTSSPNTGQVGNGIQSIQFNIITTNVQALNSSNVAVKVTDSVGGPLVALTTLAAQMTFNITGSNTYTDQTVLLPATSSQPYPSGSNLPPVDITQWSFQVTEG